MEADILASLALPHGLSWWWTSLWETNSLNQWEPGEWEKTSLHLSEEKGRGLGRGRGHQRNRKVPDSKKITHSVLMARERTTQWQFLLRWQWKAKKMHIGFVSIGNWVALHAWQKNIKELLWDMAVHNTTQTYLQRGWKREQNLGLWSIP